MDIEGIKQQARGRWQDVFARMGVEEFNPKKHGPCPKCGGTDRFRVLDDFDDTGAMLCNQCGTGKNGALADGIAAVQWLLGCEFNDAINRIGDILGIEVNGKKKRGRPKKGDPAKDLEFQDWSDDLAVFYVNAKPGISIDGLRMAGAQLARYKRAYTVIVFPIIGPKLNVEAKPVGWVAVDWQGGDLPVFDPQGNVTKTTNKKMLYGSQSGLLGQHGVARLATKGLVRRVWLVEGLTDLIALQALIPPQLRDTEVVVSNSGGANEEPGWMGQVLAACGAQVIVIRDADSAGEKGSEAWSRAIALHGGNVRKARMPYEITESKGKDLRDWILEGHDYSDLCLLADQAEEPAIHRDADGNPEPTADDYILQKEWLKKIKLEVLYEDDNNKIRVFSQALRKSSWIDKVEHLQYERLIQIAGPQVKAIVVRQGEQKSGDLVTLQDIKEAIALAASVRRSKANEIGIGVWQAKAPDGYEIPSLLAVGHASAALLNGDLVPRLLHSPEYEGLVMEFGDEEDWFDYPTLAKHLEQAGSHEWCRRVISDATILFDQWAWRSEVAPELITGMILATWIQTIWTWRPHVAIYGESGAGKSLLFERIAGSNDQLGLFGRLAMRQSKSTEAGIRQHVRNKAVVIICDEFESSRDRERILELLRAATRGDDVTRGTSDQRGRRFRLRHIAWVAATESGLEKQPDRNRFISLEMLRTTDRWEQPSSQQMVALGQKMLAVAMRWALEAKRLAGELHAKPVPGVDPRIVESYSVPASILAAAVGEDEDTAFRRLVRLMTNVDAEDAGEKDHHRLIEDIMQSHIRMKGGDVATVAQILASDSLWQEHHRLVEAHGVRYRDQCLLFHKRTLLRTLLKGTEWQGQRIDQLLLRLKGAKRDAQQIDGRVLRVVNVPWEAQ